ncbi:MAG: spermidine synthase [Spartobacteria bacterium]|nr:spermidine synthase [Spartobacteria bacterium]
MTKKQTLLTEHDMQHPARGSLLFGIIALLFFISGMAALLYQVVWTKCLVWVFGSSGYAVATTLSVFMLGLASGSRTGGALADRMIRPLWWVALIESGIAFTAYCSGFLLTMLPQFLAHLDAAWLTGSKYLVLRFSGVFAVLFIPTFLMGLTLPILVRQCVLLGDGIARRTGLLYGLNMAGGVAGCLAAGFYLIGTLGFQGALHTGVLLNGICSAGTLFMALVSQRKRWQSLSSPLPSIQRETEPTAMTDRRTGRSMQLAYFCAGFAILGLECVWTRILLFHLNSTAQTFSAMLAVILLFMSIGSVMGARKAEKCTHAAAHYGLLLLCCSLAIIASLAAWTYGASGKSFAHLATKTFSHLPVSCQTPLFDFLLRITLPTFILTALPAWIQGYAFPFAARFFTENKKYAGRNLGGAYMWNVLGCMLGPLVCGFLLLPNMGMQGSLMVCVGILVLAGCIVRIGTRSMRWWQGGFAALLFLGIAMLLPERILYSLFSDRTVFYDQAVLENQGVIIEHQGTNRIIFHEEDHCGSVLVMQQDIPQAAINLRRLYVGPTSMITDNFAAQRYTKLLGHLPALLAENPERVLVICLGTGMTLSGVAAHDTIKQIDCAELSPAVTRAVHCYDHVNGSILNDPRVHLMITDGRTHLMKTRKTYHLITLEPPPPANEGAANLYSREFYELCSHRLSSNGLVAQWIPYHLLTLEQIRALTASVLDVFPQATLWEIYPGMEFCLIGHKQPKHIDFESLQSRMTSPSVQKSLQSIGISCTADLLNGFVAGTEQLRAFVDSTPPVTDDAPSVGYCLNNLGLTTEYKPQQTAQENTLETLKFSDHLQDQVEFSTTESLQHFVDEYTRKRGAWLMDRKLATIAFIGLQALQTGTGQDQAFLPPPELDNGNPLYTSRPRITMYIQAFNRLVSYYEQQKELTQAMQYRMMANRMQNHLPETYFSGRFYKKAQKEVD